MDNPPSKRLKISRGDDDYFPGNIVKIKLYNFMTFDYLKCKPGSRLNLVIGPNGSGKSSIVCAIALGLGGEPQILGRSTSIGAYVKRGKDEGFVEIFLRGATPNEKISVKRKIDKQNKSEWMYNGKSTTKKNVMDMIEELSIQVCNLTQFLPQDRVCEFAKLTPIQLLEETEKAVGDPKLPILHQSLINKSYEVKRLEMTVKRNGETLSQLKAIHSEQERDVVRVRQRDELMEKAETMKKKLPWLKYDMKKVQYMEVKDRENDAKKKLDECAQTLNMLKEPVEKQKQEKVLLDSECKKIRSVLDQNNRKWKENMDVALRLGVEIQGIYDEIDELRNQEECRQGRISKAIELVAAAELDLEKLEPFEPPKAELERLGSKILDLEMSAKQKRFQKSEKENIVSQKKVTLCQCIERLRDMENTSTKLLQALHNSGADMIFQAHKWLQENRHNLNKEVYGPVLLEVNVSNRVHAGYLEGHIPFYIWKSFITQDPNDRDFLVENMRPFDVPVLNYVYSSGTRRAPLHISEEMRSFGIYSRLDDVFDAPNAVKEVLIGQFGLDSSYIGSRETDHVADQVSKLGILDFWTPENHYRWSRSRYGGHISASVESVNHSRLLFCSVDSGEIEKLRSRKKEMGQSINAIDVSIKSLQSEQKVLEDEASKLHREREEIVNSLQLAKRKRRELENRVEDKRRKLVSLQKEVDVEAEVKRLNFKAKKLNHQRFEHVIGVKNILLKSVFKKKRYAEKHMEVLEQDSKIKEMESGLKQQEKMAVQASMHFDSCKTATENFKKELSIAKRQAELVAVITPALEKAFREMPTTIEELQDAIEDNISEANSILLLNLNVIQEYETREHKIKEMTGNQEQDEKNLKNFLADITELRNQWLPKLRDLVSQINRTFGQNFQEMAVAGEVSLDECEQDYDRYGILIKVKFRQTGNLEVLGAHHQSGGERSVSTILYLVSLQDLTNCPFRVVDEINQGMDPINERKMFQQLVRASSQPSVPQCFMVTPKLLPDLEYGEVCTILNVMNGPWISDASKAWSGGNCWAATMGFVEEGTTAKM